MPLKKSIKIGLIVAAAILLIISIILGVYFIFFYGSNVKFEISEFNPNNENKFIINRADDFNVTRAIRNVRRFLEPYRDDRNPNVYPNCNFFNPPPENKTCGVDLNQFNPCVNVNGFGIRQGQPCIFLKLKTDPDFKPKFYNESNLPENMPVELQNDIKYYIQNNQAFHQMIWVSCEGKTDDDKRNLGSINYLPRRGFAGFHFPCKSDKLCLSPLLALRFERPKLGVPINIRCTAWAENVDEKIDLQLLVE